MKKKKKRKTDNFIDNNIHALYNFHIVIEEVIQLKKAFANIIIFISLIVASVVAVPWNNVTQWGIPELGLNANELLYKGIAGAFLILLGLISLILSFREKKIYGKNQPSSLYAAFVPLWLLAVCAGLYAAIMMLFDYSWLAQDNISLYMLIGLGVYVLNLMGFGHILSSGFRVRKTIEKIFIFVFLIELIAISGGVAYYVRTVRMTIYDGLNTLYYIGLVGLAIIFYVLHLIILSKKSKNTENELLLERELTQPQALLSKQDTLERIENAEKMENNPDAEPVGKRGHSKKQPPALKDPRKSLIVPKEQAIVSGEQNIDPTNLLYEEVAVDQEFTRINNQDKQVNSIDYYIEKPKLFKPLDPTFDMLVEYVREIPSVVTKITDNKITFYVDRNPFLVLMNYGNYYRMAFKYELEKGIRLIIKYPTISKNKSTKDDLWFKANNYGDLPKEVIYQIVKTAYDNASK